MHPLTHAVRRVCPCRCHRDRMIGCRCCYPKPEIIPPSEAEIQALIAELGPNGLAELLGPRDGWLKERDEP